MSRRPRWDEDDDDYHPVYNGSRDYEVRVCFHAHAQLKTLLNVYALLYPARHQMLLLHQSEKCIASYV
jgi:hypothetical protein